MATQKPQLTAGNAVYVPLVTYYTDRIPLSNAALAPGGLPIVLTSGGAVGVYAGVPLGVYNSVNTVSTSLVSPQTQLVFAVNQRNAITQLVGYLQSSADSPLNYAIVDAGNPWAAGGSTNTGSLAILEMGAPKQILGNPRMIVSPIGGTIMIDPLPSPVVDLGGAIITAIAPAITK